MDYKYLFGPVPSRRFGRSLGVDLLKSKTCSFDCPFCEVRATEALTAARREYVPTQAIIDELSHWQQSGGQTDYVSLAGSGEPTLHTGIGKVAEYIRGHIPARLAVLTNSTHLHLPEVRDALRPVHVVKASFSAWDDASYEAMNKPVKGITLGHIIDGIHRVRDELDSELWIEVFLMQGINDDRASVEKMASIVNTFRADRIHLNTVIRPPAYATALPVPGPAIDALLDCFLPQAEPASAFSGVPRARTDVSVDSILGMIRRRPCTELDIAGGLGADVSVVRLHLKGLIEKGQVDAREQGTETYYSGHTRKRPVRVTSV